ncbi:MAG: PLP-dependent aminotransferase family protein [Gemmatimonadota bacterium]|nr:MAG: PLP-dependent aminotransferase family protein [Gemmatimonadota bacterium]
MTIWAPDIRDREGPIYKALADALAEAVERGELGPGDGLPTHRALARQLGVTVGTVSRGYAEAERRGLIVGEVGRGTFIRGVRSGAWGVGLQEEEDGQLVDLSHNFPEVTVGEGRILAETLRVLADEPDHTHLLGYQRFSGSARQREAGAQLIRRTGLEAGGDRVLVCAGAQHALNVIFGTLTRPGDLVLTESLTYPGVKALAQILNLRLRGLPMDELGLTPEALERVCTAEEVRALYLVPTIQNPTCSIMPEERRRRIAAIAERHGVLVVEDDVHGFLLEETPLPLSAFAREHACYIASTGKSIAPALRISYVLAPERLVERLDAGVRATVWMASPLTAEIAALWIRDGKVDEILEGKRAATRERQRIFEEIMGSFDYSTHPAAIHVWLRLPEPWRSDDFVEQARHRGVLITGAESFAVGRDVAPHAVRICIGAPASAETLRRGLETLREILEGRSEPCCSVV